MKFWCRLRRIFGKVNNASGKDTCMAKSFTISAFSLVLFAIVVVSLGTFFFCF